MNHGICSSSTICSVVDVLHAKLALTWSTIKLRRRSQVQKNMAGNWAKNANSSCVTNPSSELKSLKCGYKTVMGSETICTRTVRRHSGNTLWIVHLHANVKSYNHTKIYCLNDLCNCIGIAVHNIAPLLEITSSI